MINDVINSEELNVLKEMYPKGTRILLKSMKDPYNPVPSETKGTVVKVDSMGTYEK